MNKGGYVIMEKMTEKNRWENQFRITKTIKEEMIPTGYTNVNLQRVNMLKREMERNEDLKKMKEICDEYYRNLIDVSLRLEKVRTLGWESLIHKYRMLNKDEKEIKALEKEQEDLRKKISKGFGEKKAWAGEQFIKKILPQYLMDHYTGEELEEKLRIVKKFKGCTMFLSTFFKNRENIFTDKPIHTAVGHRITSENAILFAENINTYKKMESNVTLEIERLQREFLQRGINISEVFKDAYYVNVLTQKQIEAYNKICGDINQHMNEYCQKQKLKFSEFRMRELKKQILAVVGEHFEIPEKIESTKEVYRELNEYYESLKELHGQFEELKSVQLKYSQIYVQKKGYDRISRYIGGQWDLIQECMKKDCASGMKGTKKNHDAKIEEEVAKVKYQSIEHIQKLVCTYEEDRGHKVTDYVDEFIVSVCDLLGADHIITRDGERIELPLQYEPGTDLLKNDTINQRRLSDIKTILDWHMDMLEWLKTFLVNDLVLKDEEFYMAIEELNDRMQCVISVYNRIRNYVTQKGYEPEKIRICFDKGTILTGWTTGDNYQYSGFLLMRNDKYYLGIINTNEKSVRKILDGNEECKDESDYIRIGYHLINDASKQLPRIFVMPKAGKKSEILMKDEQCDYIWDGYCHNKHNESKEFMRELIDYYKRSIMNYDKWKGYCFKFSSTESYDNMQDFYKEVREQSYNISFSYINENVLEQLDKDGKIYLFQVYNKDFAAGSTGTPNLHTMYLQNLFSSQNLELKRLRLGGNAELFYRPGTEKDVTHRKGSILVDRTYVREEKDGIEVRDTVPEKEYLEIYRYLNGKQKGDLSESAKQWLDKVHYREAPCDIIKDKRYAQEKYFLHFSVEINPNAEGQTALNDNVRRWLSEEEDIHVIGIDRGERNLIYVSLMDGKGRIKDQKSYNIVNSGNKEPVDYLAKLKVREKERDEARRNWKAIGKIKDIKTGYLSYVVHEIVEMAVREKAIIVMEDLNYGFKRGRFKVERQVYQKFEEMLINKLNYVVDKQLSVDEPGGLLRGYQLAFIPKDKKSSMRQNGIVFYVPAGYTSKIDPTTGFVNIFKFPQFGKGDDDGNGKDYDKIRAFFGKFDEIRYECDEKVTADNTQEVKERYRFDFDYSKFETHLVHMKKTKWTVYAEGERIKRKKVGNYWTSEVISDIALRMSNTLNIAGIEYKDGHNLVNEICALRGKQAGIILNELLEIIRLTVQLRNSTTEGDVDERDEIISPVLNEKYGCFYHSTEYKQQNGDVLPKDADANGAYCIGLKGIYEIRQIKNKWKEGMTKGEGKALNEGMRISHDQWFEFIQNMNKGE